MERSGSIFNSTSDTEVVVHLIKKSKHSPFRSKVKEALSLLKGAFSILLLTNDQLIVARDRNGLRPLSLGKLGDSYVVASETCAFDLIGAEFIREVEPGELLIISNNGLEVDSYVEKDGDYKIRLSGVIDYEGAEWQSIEFPVKVDTVKPTAKASFNSNTKTISISNFSDSKNGTGVEYWNVLVNGEVVAEGLPTSTKTYTISSALKGKDKVTVQVAREKHY